MYQTVGQDAIEFVAKALDVPLYRRVISGEAVEQGPEYGGRDAKDAGGVLGDETEDLFALLENVKVCFEVLTYSSSDQMKRQPIRTCKVFLSVLSSQIIRG